MISGIMDDDEQNNESKGSSNIYKIYQMSLSQDNTRALFCTNKGIHTFRISDLSPIVSCSQMGPVKMACCTYSETDVFFVGSEDNEEYNERTIVLYDLKDEDSLFLKSFSRKITDIKTCNKFIFIRINKDKGSGDKEGESNKSVIHVFLCTNNYLSTVKDINLSEEGNEYFNVFPYEEDHTSKIGLVIVKGKSMEISTIDNQTQQTESKGSFELPFEGAQIVQHFKEKNDLLFIVDGEGKYIYSYDMKTKEIVNTFFRGQVPGKITSLILLEGNYIAISNLAHSIHIFDLNEKVVKKEEQSWFGWGTGLVKKAVKGVTGLEMNYPKSILEIFYSKIIKDEENVYFKTSFLENGCLLVGIDQCNFRVLAYNGYGYKLRFVKLNKNYQFLESKEIISPTWGSTTVKVGESTVSKIIEGSKGKESEFELL